MKNAMLLSVLVIGLLLTACSKPSAKSIAEKICSKREQYMQAKQKNDETAMKTLDAELDKMRYDLKTKYKDDKKFTDEIKVEMDKCKQELEQKYGNQ